MSFTFLVTEFVNQLLDKTDTETDCSEETCEQNKEHERRSLAMLPYLLGLTDKINNAWPHKIKSHQNWWES